MGWNIRDLQTARGVDFFKKAKLKINAIKNNIEIIRNCGYKLVDYFVLPESGWWDEYYLPLEKRIAILRKKYKDDVKAQEVLEEEQQEIDLYRKYSKYYGYVFYIMQKR